MAEQTSILLHFDEFEDAVLPSDKALGLNDLTGDLAATPDLVVPPVVDGSFGLARAFADDLALVGTDLTAAQTQLHRDVTIEALISLDLSAMAVAEIATIVQRGKSGSAPERVLWGLKLTKLTTSTANVQMRWQEIGGAEASVPGFVIQVPSSHFYLWAVRRWISTTSAVIRYGINDIYLGELPTADADIGEGDGGSTTVGCRGSGVDYDDFHQGNIYALRVSNFERGIFELAHVFRSLSIHPDTGARIMRGHLPSFVYSEDPESIVQRELAVEGAGLGLALADLDEIQNALPDRAWSFLSRWEAITNLPLAAGNVEERRARILSYLRTIQGYTREKIAEALESVLDIDAASITFLEGTNNQLETAWAAIPAWLREEANIDTVISVGGGAVTLEIRQDTGQTADYILSQHVAIVTPIDAHEFEPEPFANAVVRAVFDTGHATPAGADTIFGGVYMEKRITRSACVVGFARVGGVNGIYSTFRVAPGAFSAPVLLEATADPDDYHVGLRYDGAGEFTAFWDSVGPVTGNSAVVSAGFEPNAAGAIGMEFSSPSTYSFIFTELETFFPKGIAPYCWAAFRDPADPGSPDYLGANAIVRRIKPAQTFGSVVASEELVCDDPNSLLDQDLLGG